MKYSLKELFEASFSSDDDRTVVEIPLGDAHDLFEMAEDIDAKTQDPDVKKLCDFLMNVLDSALEGV